MANFCCICRKYFLTNKFLFNVPEKKSNDSTSIERHSLWLLAINKKNIDIGNATICSKHFVKGKPVNDKTDIDWVPTINLGNKRKHEDENSKHSSDVENPHSVYNPNVRAFCLEESYEIRKQKSEAQLNALFKAEMERDEFISQLEVEYEAQTKENDDSAAEESDYEEDDDRKRSDSIANYVARLEAMNRALERELNELRQQADRLNEMYNNHLLNHIIN